MRSQGVLGRRIHRAASFSYDGTYRYRLVRRWDSKPVLSWLMLNPSTADGQSDDPTIRRCMVFADDWGYGGIAVYNLFALRATDPKVLLGHPDPVGAANADWLRDLQQPALFPPHHVPTVVAAWGAHRAVQLLREQAVPHAQEMNTVLRGLRLKCLGATKAGHPRHPLYVAGSQPLVPWPVAT